MVYMQDVVRPYRIAAVFDFLEKYFCNQVIALNYLRVTFIGVDFELHISQISIYVTSLRAVSWNTLFTLKTPKYWNNSNDSSVRHICIRFIRDIAPSNFLRYHSIAPPYCLEMWPYWEHCNVFWPLFKSALSDTISKTLYYCSAFWCPI